MGKFIEIDYMDYEGTVNTVVINSDRISEIYPSRYNKGVDFANIVMDDGDMFSVYGEYEKICKALGVLTMRGADNECD